LTVIPFLITLCGTLLSLGATCEEATPDTFARTESYTVVCGPEVDEDGVVAYRLRSPFMRGESRVRILYPAQKTERLLFVLPVAPWPGYRDKWRKYGDGLAEVKRHDYQNVYGYTVIAPDFTDHMPWFVDHATDPHRRHESYMMHVLIPFVDTVVKTKHPHRDLVGFSKSGFGSLNLLLRYPDTFHGAALWDPGGITQPYEPARLGSLSDAAGSASQFERHRIENTVVNNARFFREKRRIAIAGYSSEKFKKNLTTLHQLLLREKVAHVYGDTVCAGHRWSSGWLDAVMASLNELE